MLEANLKRLRERVQEAGLLGPVAGRAYSAWEKFLMRRPFSRIVFPSDHALQLGLDMGIRRDRCVSSSGIPPAGRTTSSRV